MCDTKLHRLHEFPILPVRLHRYGVGGRRGWRRHVVWAAGCVWAFTRRKFTSSPVNPVDAKHRIQIKTYDKHKSLRIDLMNHVSCIMYHVSCIRPTPKDKYGGRTDARYMIHET